MQGWLCPDIYFFLFLRLATNTEGNIEGVVGHTTLRTSVEMLTRTRRASGPSTRPHLLPLAVRRIVDGQLRRNSDLRNEARSDCRSGEDAALSRRRMVDALRESSTVAVIAEMKRMSPSHNDLDPGMDPAKRAEHYCRYGATAISVLTQEIGFGGSMRDLDASTGVAGRHDVPVLQKDFILEEVQIRQAHGHGASSVLLMMGILGRDDVQSDPYERLFRTAVELGMEPIVEVRDKAQLDAAFDGVRPKIVGINNRDFETDDLEIDLSTFEELVEEIPSGVVKVAESGMNSVADIERMADAGADAVLIGGALMSGGLKLDEAVQVQKPAKREAARAAA